MYVNNKHFYEYAHTLKIINSTIMEFFHWSYFIDSDTKLRIYYTTNRCFYEKGFILEIMFCYPMKILTKVYFPKSVTKTTLQISQIM